MKTLNEMSKMQALFGTLCMTMVLKLGVPDVEAMEVWGCLYDTFRKDLAERQEQEQAAAELVRKVVSP